MEAIQCKKCCFCIPLRRGILLWSYLKLLPLIGLAIFFGMFISARDFLQSAYEYFMALFALLVIDIVFYTALIVGTHMKNVLLLRVFYWYSMVELVLLLVIGGTVIGTSFVTGLGPDIALLLSTAIATVISVAFQIYFILLVRSELRKLNHETAVLFINVKKDGSGSDEKINSQKNNEERIRYDRIQDD